MAHQLRRAQPRQSEGGASDADLAQHLGLLDWEALEPIGEGEAKVAAGQDSELAGFFLGGELMEDGDDPGAFLIYIHSNGVLHAMVHGWQEGTVALSRRW